jgi:hypothetical protein
MRQGSYDWDRRWHKRGIRDTGSNEVNLGPLLSSFESCEDLERLDDLQSIQCLILLGEPGMGKSWELKRIYKALEQNLASNQLLFARLGMYTSPERLLEDQRFENWKHGTYDLYMFLDGLDEGTMRPVQIGHKLWESLRTLPRAALDRLFLRITCRTFDWPDTLVADFASLWDGNAPLIYELDPLTSADIMVAAEAEGLDPKAFLQEVDFLGLRPLAVKPLTLRSLIREFRENQGGLPATQVELYERYCLYLCEEQNPKRIELEKTGRFDPHSRLKAASQIAAIMLLTNHNSVWIYGSLEDTPPGAIPIAQLENSQLDVGHQLIREALSTGLFSSRGEKCLGWAHQTYAEFLAARYLNSYMTPSQIRELLFQDDMVVPQLRALAAWLSNMNASVLEDILQRDAKALLQGDVVLAETAYRPRLVSAFLHILDEGQAIDLGYNRPTLYRRWAHPDLAGQLSPYIVDNCKNEHARYAAIDIAEACEIKELQHDLVQVALDPQNPHMVRGNAAYAVMRIGDQTTKQQLEPLIWGGSEDLDDELKGIALSALWPGYLTTETLFSVLTPPKRPNFFGAYRMFLGRLREHLTISDMPLALKWAKEQAAYSAEPPLEHDYAIEHVIDEIVVLAWQHLDNPAVLNGFVALALARLELFQPIVSRETRVSDEDEPIQFREELLANNDRRRRVLRAAFPILSEYDDRLHFLAHYETPLLIPDDLGWLLEVLETEQAEDLQDLLLQLIRIAFNPWDHRHLEIMFEAMQRNTILAERFRSFFVADLNSEAAHRSREHHQKLKEIETMRQTPQRQRLEPPPAEIIRGQLEKCETEDPGEWWRLAYNMIFEADGTRHYFLEPDLTATPGWREVDNKTRARIVMAGIRYLEEQGPKEEEWFTQGLTYWPAVAGYRALALLARLLPDMSVVKPETWRKWASIVVAYPSHYSYPGYERDPKLHRLLVCTAYKFAPEEVITFLTRLIDLRDEKGQHVIPPYELLDKFSDCWDERLDVVFLNKLREPGLSDDSFGFILARLLERNVPEAIIYATSLVVPLPSDDEGRNRAIRATQYLMTHTDNTSWWSSIWPVIQKEPDFGRAVIERVAFSHDERRSAAIGARLPENDLADFYLWLVEQYPFEEDPDILALGMHQVTDREHIADWRDRLLLQLAQRGSPEATQSLERISMTYPAVYRIQRALEEARERVRRDAWKPKRPEDIFQMVKEAGRRDTLITEIRYLLAGTEQRLLDRILGRIDQCERRTQLEIQNVLKAIESREGPDQEILGVLINLQEQLRLLVDSQALCEDTSLAQEANVIVETISTPGLDARHRLKLTVPIIPLILAYEGEVEFNIRASLEAIWKKLRGWANSGDGS